MYKKTLALVLVLILTLSLGLLFVACDKMPAKTPTDSSTGTSVDNPAKTDEVFGVDDDYVLTLSGLVDKDGNLLEDVKITKGQIRKYFNDHPDKQVVYTMDNPVTASDKTDDEGNKIPHAVEGVYLDDLMAEFTQSAPIGTYTNMTLNGSDGYVSVADAEQFVSGEGHSGSKMIICFSYDGNLLTPDCKSGALRAVFADQIANIWAKKLSVIEFGIEVLSPPEVARFTVLETLFGDEQYEGEYSAEGSDHYGLSMKKLLDGNVLKALEEDKMYCNGWDYEGDFEDSSKNYTEYGVWTKYEIYSNGYILTHEKKEGESEKKPVIRAPVFDGPTFQKGMTVKNILALEVGKTAVVSLKTAMVRFDPDMDDSFKAKELLALLKMDCGNGCYVINNNERRISADEMKTAEIKYDEGTYSLVIGTESVVLKSISVDLN